MSDYKQTLNLPQTGFPMKANLSQREPQRLARWQDMDLSVLHHAGDFFATLVGDQRHSMAALYQLSRQCIPAYRGSIAKPKRLNHESNAVVNSFQPLMFQAIQSPSFACRC